MKNEEMKSISILLQKFAETVIARNLSLYLENQSGADPDIESWLSNAEVSQNPIPKGKWKNVDKTNGTSEKKMLKTAQKMSLSQAIEQFTQMLKEGIFDKEGTSRIIFLEEKDRDGNSLELICNRYCDDKIDLYIGWVNHVNVFDTSNCYWFEQQVVCVIVINFDYFLSPFYFAEKQPILSISKSRRSTYKKTPKTLEVFKGKFKTIIDFRTLPPVLQRSIVSAYQGKKKLDIKTIHQEEVDVSILFPYEETDNIEVIVV